MSKEKKRVVPSATENEPATASTEPSSSETAVVPTPVAKTEAPASAETVSILPIINSIPENQAKMAEQIGIPIRQIMRWAAAMENTIIAQGKALETLGVNLKPLIDAVQARSATQNPSNAPSSGGAGTLGQILDALKTFGPMITGGGESGMATKLGELYLERSIRQSMESESMGNWMQREFFKRTFPTVFSDWEKSNTPTATK